MKSIYLSAFLLCTSLGIAQTPASDAYASTIESEDLKQLLYVYASDFFQGRETGTLGQKRAVTFLKEFYESRGIQAGAGSEDYFQKMTLTIKGEEIDTENVIAIIEGSEKPEEYLVISSHLDHIGTHEGEINNGADDDGSGTVTLLEIAEAFQKAVADGKGPKRSIIFLTRYWGRKRTFGFCILRKQSTISSSQHHCELKYRYGRAYRSETSKR